MLNGLFPAGRTEFLPATGANDWHRSIYRLRNYEKNFQNVRYEENVLLN